MAKINLRDFYPFSENQIIDVPDDVAEALNEADRKERNYFRQMYRHKAHYSLDAGDDIEHEALFISHSPCEIYERKVTMELLYSAIHNLPEAQSRRIYAYYILGVPQKEIARAEGVSEVAICLSIERGLKNLESFLKNIL